MISFFSGNKDHGQQVSAGEIKIAAFIAEHNIPMVVADHIPRWIHAV